MKGTEEQTKIEASDEEKKKILLDRSCSRFYNDFFGYYSLSSSRN